MLSGAYKHNFLRAKKYDGNVPINMCIYSYVNV